VNARVVLRKAGITLAVLLAIFAVFRYLPYILGAATSFVVFPFYNLVCSGSNPTNIGSALLRIPQREDFQTFLNNQGCSAADADTRDKLRQPANGDPYFGQLKPFWSDDPISNFLSNVATLLGRAFTEGLEDGASWLLFTFRTSVLFEALYYLLYTAFTVCTIQLINSGTQDLYHFVKRQLLEMQKKPTA
jgi:hypothetical protein